MTRKPPIARRSLLLAGLGAAGAGALTACSGSGSGSGSGTSGGPTLVGASGPEVARAEKARADTRTGTGKERKHTLTAASAKADLGAGITVRTWAFDGRAPGKEIRIDAGDTLVASLANQLPDRTTTSLHWHGIALRGDMDGVPPATQTAVRPGSTFTYRFIAPDPGTYFFHPHVGVQLDRGLYAPLIVEDPKEPLAYDAEWVVVLDDWLDGVTGTPDQAFAELSKGMGPHAGMDMGDGGTGGSGMPGHDMGGGSAPPSRGFTLMGARSELLGGDAGDVAYPHHLVNGRVPADPDVHRGEPGRKVRLRIVNAGSDTAYRVALGGHRMTITHTDGFPVRHEEVDALLVGMGERYDVLVTLADGVFPLVALAEGKNATGMALVRTGSGAAPAPTVRPKELDGRLLTATQLRAADAVRLEAAKPDIVHRVDISGTMAAYDWALNGRRFDMDDPTANPLLIEEGRRVRLEFVNRTEMWHPMHLHGHTYQLGAAGPRKDTAIVLPGRTLSVDFDADNPGQWMLHCHNAYHGEAGMMALVAYRS
ncbi:multicopper oxidase family protein [Streptomyces showdoensis]|uniref:Copper oxidase n=1 Tax=Streptomyces showdoensis TaxID=68268 RepID=A0A2P2GPV8_STREW|nr:multicopper oxidase family protein [Streptomyces showdoensis]KKZ73516.1 copper oxidase [Streptomyces showdoensis]